jgi:sugar lactone lactonase YvrE
MKTNIGKFPVWCALVLCSTVFCQTPKVVTIAGGYLGTRVPATSAAFAYPVSVARDSKGNLYVSDSNNCRIRKIATNGIITSIAGTGICAYSGDKGPAQSAKLDLPQGIAFNSQQALLIADSNNHVIRKIASSGIVTTIAGNGTAGYSGDGGPALQASLYYPTAVAADSSGNIYIADSSNAGIRKVDPSGIIRTVAGNQVPGFSGDGGLATSAQIGTSASGVVPDDNGNFYIADTQNARVRKVDANGIITTYAGNGSFQISGDGGPATAAGIGPVSSLLLRGNHLYITSSADILAVDLTTQIINIIGGGGINGYRGDGGSALSALFSYPQGMATDPAGDIFIADTFNNRIRKLDPSQIVTTVGGGYIGDRGPATAASLNRPAQLAFGPQSSLYVPEQGGNRVRRVSSNGMITTFAGTGITGYSGDGGPATSATISAPQSVVADSSGNIYIADTGNSRIRRVDSSGLITTFSSIPAVSLAIDSNDNIFASDFNVIWKISPAGSASIVAGMQFCFGYGGDGGPATQACLFFPYGVAVDKSGDLYIADWINYRVRKVNSAGIISTVAGTGQPGYSGDGGPATSAMLNLPQDLAVDGKGNLYIGDAQNARVRIVSPSGTIRTLAGTGNFGYNGNGLPATQTDMYRSGLTVDAKGIVYFSDDSGRVRRIH